jgi:CRP/FNR family transcriptional regulator, cyclic AMP receptor protein
MCQEYGFALEEASRIFLSGTVAARLGRLLIALSNQTGEHRLDGTLCFPILLTHDEMASMACTTRETVTRTLGQFRKDGWISIAGSVVKLEQPEQLRAL